MNEMEKIMGSINNPECDETSLVIKTANVLLGVDIGTTNISVVVVDYDAGEVVDSYFVPNISAVPCDSDFAEFDAELICSKAKSIVDCLVKVYPNTKCIGITGQMHGMVYLSKDGKAVSPFYNWQDGRGNRKFNEKCTYSREIFSRTGYMCSSGYAFATMFYNRINGVEPTCAKTFCTIMDYFVMSLTSLKSPLVHTSNAASFGLYDVKNNCFDTLAIEKLGLQDLVLPEISSGSDIAGYYANIPVCVAIGDNQASFFGSVKNEKTSALVNFGTGSQVSVVAQDFCKVPQELEIRPYLFGKYLVCGSALCGGKAYAIVEKFFSEYVKAFADKASSQYDVMNSLAKEAYEKGQALLVSTKFCGTRQAPTLRGVISEISDTNFTPGNLILGVLYGMANELKTYFEYMECEGITQLVASGNAVKKNTVLQNILKDIFKADVHLTHSNEEAATGCALFAGISSSVIEFSHAKNIIKEEK